MIIKVSCSSNQGLPGVIRIDSIDIELPDGSRDDKLAANVFNQLAEKEYFTESDGWKNQLKEDVAYKVGCNLADIYIE